MKVLITGTHFTPAQAVIEELQKYPAFELIYIGRNHTMEGDDTPSVESEVLPKMGVRFIPLSAGRLQRQFTFYTIPSLLKIPIGFIQALFYLATEQPDLTISFGGYIGLPVIIAAWILSIPSIIHEQALVPGLANTISGLFSEKIAISFNREYDSYKKEKIVITGNPIRKAMENNSTEVPPEVAQFIARKQKEKMPLIVLTGGNQGAHSLNEIVFRNLTKLTESYCFFHQTGRNKFNDFSQATSLQKTLVNKDRYFPIDWTDPASLALLLKEADLIISRAGINTLIEILKSFKPHLIIPLDVKEQRYNAEYFQKIGEGEVLLQRDLTDREFLKKIGQMAGKKNENIGNRNIRDKQVPEHKKNKKKAEEIKEELYIENGSQRLVQEIFKILEKDE